MRQEIMVNQFLVTTASFAGHSINLLYFICTVEIVIQIQQIEAADEAVVTRN